VLRAGRSRVREIELLRIVFGHGCIIARIQRAVPLAGMAALTVRWFDSVH
jgi:hypothetical protein